jgi:hypothetical protein
MAEEIDTNQKLKSLWIAGSSSGDGSSDMGKPTIPESQLASTGQGPDGRGLPELGVYLICFVSTNVLTYGLWRRAVMKLRTKATRKKRKRAPRALENKGVYRGKQAKTGNSLGLRFERALFHSHPEFNGEVEAYVIGPGRMLVVAEPRKKSAEEDPVLSSFMSFLASDMHNSPGHITPVDSDVVDRIGTLVRKVKTFPEEELGDEALI